MAEYRSRISRFFPLLKEALKGSEQSFTTGSINRAIFLLSVPMILEMSMESLFAVVDAFFVGKLGKEALATVGLTEAVLTLVYSLGFGLSMAATALVARRTGEGDADGAGHTAAQALYVSLGLSLAMALTGAIWAEDLLVIMGQSPEVAARNYHFPQIIFGTNAVIVLLFLINGLFRGAGDAAIAMRSLWLANGLNIILCPLLINGWGPVPAFGLKGAALATSIGRGIGVIYQVVQLVRGRGVLRILRKHLRPDLPLMGRFARQSFLATAQLLINSISWLALMRIVARFGEDAVAGYTIGIRIIVFTLLPALGLSNAAATLVGQNLGAGQPDRAERSAWRAAFGNMVFLGTVAIIFFILARPIVGLFTQDPAVTRYGIESLRYISLGYIFYAYGMVIISAFNGAGDSRTPTIINLFGFWGFQIPLAYALAIVLGWGPKGVFSAVAIAESAMAVVAIYLFRKGRWKLVNV